MTIENSKKAMIVSEGKLVEEYYKGNIFWVFKNPNPTTINEFKSSLANTVVALCTNAIPSTIINADAKKNGYY